MQAEAREVSWEEGDKQMTLPQGKPAVAEEGRMVV